MQREIKISKDLKLPLEITTQTVAILAKRRVGKSYTMRGIAEQLLDCGQQIILVDPKGDQWGVRSSSDGKKPGYPVVILGGEHGDVPIEVNSGELVAKLVVEERVSVLLDLSTFRKHEVATFMSVFLENLYRLKAQEKYRTPVMLIIDEADAIAPQKPQKGEERMLGAAEDIVRRGGQRGIGCILVTQRSAVLNKNVLTQAQMLIVLRTIAPQDLAAMNAWIDVHGTLEQKKVLMDSLPSLPVGDAWFWSPGWPTNEGIFKLVHVLPIKTFDSAATPKPGEKKITPKNLADINLDTLKKQMSATIEKAKSENPTILNKRIRELELELKTKTAPLQQKNVEVDSKAIQKAIIETEERMNKEYQIIINDIKKQFDDNVKFTIALIKSLEDIQKITSKLNLKKIEPLKNPIIRTIPMRYSDNKDRPVVRELFMASPGLKIPSQKKIDEEFKINDNENITLGKCSRYIYSYLVMNQGSGRSKTQVAIATGYSQNSGGFNNSISELSALGLILRENRLLNLNGPVKNDLIIALDISLEKWLPKLGACSRKIWELLIKDIRNDTFVNWPKENIALETGYSVTSGGFNNSISELSALGLIERIPGGLIKINPEILDL